VATVRILLIDFNPFMAAVTPISLGYLGAVLRLDGHAVTVVSLGSESAFSVAGLATWLCEMNPDLVGFGAYQRNMLHVRSLARLIKEVVPGARVVLGGPQGMFLPDAALAVMPEVDHLSRGEGEGSIRALVTALREGTDADAPIPGVTTRLSDTESVTGDPAPSPRDLDLYPSPWLEGVLDPSQWEEAILLGSRGCPNRCRFCLTPSAFRGVRWHSVDRVLDEIAFIASRGSGRLWFADPNFCASPERVVDILEGVLHRNLEVQMWLEIRADMLNAELIRLMHRAGVYRVAMGLESASQRVSQRLDKRIDPDRVGWAARTLLAARIDVELFSQYALPGERIDDAMETLDFVKDCGVSIRGNSNAQQMQLYFGSEFSSHHGKYGIRPLRRRFPPYLAIGTEFETEWMTQEEIARVGAAWRAASEDGGKRIVS
jgi:radical SAM superfamily enzyme YgiQ (UPF0313 family)